MGSVMRDKAELLAALEGIHTRRIEAFSAGIGTGLTTTEHLALIPEATTVEDMDTLNDAVEQLDEYAKAIVALVKDVWPEWGRYRCAVCGMTAAQAKAANYDCATEC